MLRKINPSPIYLSLLLATGCAMSPADEDLAQQSQKLVVSSSACRVEYTVNSEWQGGFGASIQVTNKGSSANHWTLSFSYPDGQNITSLWNGKVSQNGAEVSVSDVGWNAGLASGSSVAVGFNGTWSGTNGAPRNFKLNGVSCEGTSPGDSGGGTGNGDSGGGSSTGGVASGGSSPGGSTASGGSSTGSCDAPAWRQGQNYSVGALVTYGGRLYIAEHENPGYDPTISTWFWDEYGEPCNTGATGGSGATGGGGGTTTSGFSALVSEADFNALFPNRNSFYSYDGLLKAIDVYPAFAGTGDETTRKREAAAFLANVAHETGQLVYVEEIAKGEYCDNSPWFCPCVPGKRYYGRGPIQLSWNYNYCAASESIFGDREVLRTEPERVAREPWLAWATALWFWMTQNGAGTMTPHQAMTQGAGFGETIRSINGGLECNGGNAGAVNARIGYYRTITGRVGVSTGSPLGC